MCMDIHSNTVDVRILSGNTWNLVKKIVASQSCINQNKIKNININFYFYLKIRKPLILNILKIVKYLCIKCKNIWSTIGLKVFMFNKPIHNKLFCNV